MINLKQTSYGVIGVQHSLKELATAPMPAAKKTEGWDKDHFSLSQVAETVDQGADSTEIINRVANVSDDLVRGADGLQDLIQGAELISDATELAETGSSGLKYLDTLTDIVAGTQLPTLLGQSSDTVQLWLSKNIIQHSSKIQRGSKLMHAAGNKLKGTLPMQLWSQTQTPFMQRQVFPVINAAGAAAMIYKHKKQFKEANKTDDTRSQVISGVQIALNVTSGITGFFSGKAEVVSSLTGLKSLFLEWAYD